jgi:glycerol kinase
MRWKGSIFIAGAVVQWLRDGLKIIREAPETQPLAEPPTPKPGRLSRARLHRPRRALLGRGLPRRDLRLTRNSGPAELARAALESVGYQTRDLLEAMRADWPARASAAVVLRVDGGMTRQRLDDAVPRRHARRAGGPARRCWRPRRWARPGSPA